MDSFDFEPNTPEPVHDEKQLGMKWYKFQRYFALILGAIINIAQGVLYLTGMIYSTEAQISPEKVYQFYGIGLHAADILYGVALIGMGILALVLRDKMAKFKVDTIQFLKIFYVTGVVISIVYMASASIITGISMIDARAIGSMIGSITMMLVNITYFNKRAHLFVN